MTFKPGKSKAITGNPANAASAAVKPKPSQREVKMQHRSLHKIYRHFFDSLKIKKLIQPFTTN